MVFFLILIGVFCFNERMNLPLGLTILLAFGAATIMIAPEAEGRHLGLIGGGLVGLILLAELVLAIFRGSRLQGNLAKRPLQDEAMAARQAAS